MEKILSADTVPMDQQGYEARGVLRVFDQLKGTGYEYLLREYANRVEYFTGVFRENAALGRWEYVYHSNQ